MNFFFSALVFFSRPGPKAIEKNVRLSLNARLFFRPLVLLLLLSLLAEGNNKQCITSEGNGNAKRPLIPHRNDAKSSKATSLLSSFFLFLFSSSSSSSPPPGRTRARRTNKIPRALRAAPGPSAVPVARARAGVSKRVFHESRRPRPLAPTRCFFGLEVFCFFFLPRRPGRGVARGLLGLRGFALFLEQQQQQQ